MDANFPDTHAHLDTQAFEPNPILDSGIVNACPLVDTYSIDACAHVDSCTVDFGPHRDGFALYCQAGTGANCQ